MERQRSGGPTPFRWILAGAALAVAVRVAASLVAPGTMGDTASYLACAEVVLSTFTCPQPDAFPFFRAPGYPAFLALTGGGATALLAQAVLDGATAVLLGVLAARLLSPAAGVLTAFGWAVYPFAVSFASTLQTETLYAFLAVASFGALAAWRAGAVRTAGERPAAGGEASPGPGAARTVAWLAAAGVAAGLATATRPGHQLLLPLVAGWTAWVAWRGPAARKPVRNPLRKPARASLGAALLAPLAFTAGAALVLIPAVAAASAHHPGFTGLTNGAWFNFWLGNGPFAGPLYTTPAADWAALERSLWLETVPERVRAMEGLGLADREALWREWAFDWIAAHPRAWLEVKGRAFLHTLRPWVDPRAFSAPVVAVSVVATLGAVWAGVAGLVLAARDATTRVDRPLVVLFLLPLVASVGLNLLFQPHIRFRAALVDPLLLPFGVWLAWRAWRRWRGDRRGGPGSAGAG